MCVHHECHAVVDLSNDGLTAFAMSAGHVVEFDVKTAADAAIGSLKSSANPLRSCRAINLQHADIVHAPKF